MPTPVIAANTCIKLVDAAARSCQPVTMTPTAPMQANPNWDAMAASFASLSNAFAWGSLILALVAFLAAFAWGRIITARAEREAREMAEAEVRKWLKDVAPPLIAREALEFMRAFRGENPISDDVLATLVAAAGGDGKEGQNGQK